MRILIIDDDQALSRSLQIHLERTGHEVLTRNTAGAGIEALLTDRFDLAFIDLKLPDQSGLDILQNIRDARLEILPVMITGVQEAKATIDAVRLGAFDYIRKPLDLDLVMVTLEKASQHLVQRTTGSASPIPTASSAIHEIVGADPKIIEILKQIGLLSESRIPVLIQGESGTGKELVARALHEAGSSGKPFVAVNCSALVPTLLESELFGHEKGAFTGADASKPGKLEYAGEGTLFLDEIGDMAEALQSKMLRALQEREFERVGGTRTLPFRARVVAATHRDLRQLIADSGFREDLYFRLAVATVHVPPLRERRGDIALIAQHLVACVGRELHREVTHIDQHALSHLQTYDWPGNVRELTNVLTRAILLTRGQTLSEHVVLTAMGQGFEQAARPGEIATLRDAEKVHVGKALLACHWNISHTAELLDISRVTLRKKIEEYGLRPPAGT